MTIASSVAITCCFVVYSTSSAFAYIAFRDDTCDVRWRADGDLTVGVCRIDELKLIELVPFEFD